MNNPKLWIPRLGTKPALFFELAGTLNIEGFTRKVFVSEFVGKYSDLKFGNGGDWVREDGTLGKRFNIKRYKESGGHAITAIQLQGFKKNPIQKPIPIWIRQALQNERCVILDTQEVEVDHKDGRRDDPRLADASRLTLDDFQPLSKAANNAKRQHCKECRITNMRYDARRLGFPIPQFIGNGEYNGTCIGCYWHDPKRFKETVCADRVSTTYRSVHGNNKITSL